MTEPTTGANPMNIEGLRDALVSVVRADTEFAVAIDAEFTEPEYVTDHVIEYLGKAGLAIVPATRVLDDEDLAALRHLVADHKLVQTEVRQALRDTTTADLARIARILAADAARTEEGETQLYEFECPECGLTHVEHGRLFTKDETECGYCKAQRGESVKVVKRMAAAR